MARAIWTGSVSFGLVNVPVGLYSAVQTKGVRFHQLHREDNVRIQQKRVCPADGEEVAFEDIVKGYELTPGQYVVIDPAELEALAPERRRTIDIEDFVELSEIDPIYFDKPYYLVPTAGGEKPYRLLLEAMRASKRVAIARFVLRGRENLVAIRSANELLVLETMVFADEVVPAKRVLDPEELAAVKTTQRELSVAQQLVESLSSEWDPGRYRDSYREQVLALIDRKAAGEELTAVQAPEPTAAKPAPDLIGALEESLRRITERAGNGDAAAGKRKAPAKRRAKASTPKPKAAAKKPAS
ncbi:MAG: Ku protein [Solirubrobacteraceae bacterium]